jgi:hypothetical protein
MNLKKNRSNTSHNEKKAPIKKSMASIHTEIYRDKPPSTFHQYSKENTTPYPADVLKEKV